MSKYCDMCGTRMAGNICPNCQEELYIYKHQIYPDGTDIQLSDEFAEKVNRQKDEVTE